MISEEKTFEMFGYYSTDFKPRSRKKVVAICDKCGKERIVSKHDYYALCLSCACKGKKLSKNTRQKISKANLGKKRTEETRQKLSKANLGKNNNMYGKHHTEETKRKLSKLFSGENNPSWNPNLTDEDREIGRRIPGYKEWRKLVYNRDNYTCQICKDKSGGNLVAHHIEGYNYNKDLRITLENGVTLCEKCHNKFHKKYGKGNNTKKTIY